MNWYKIVSMEEKDTGFIGGQKDILDDKKGAFTKYKEIFPGDVSFFFFLNSSTV